MAWPTGEFGGMNLEGAVRLGYRKELEAITDDAERDAVFAEMVDRAYEHGRALNVASHFEIDDVIDPAETRQKIVAGFRMLKSKREELPRLQARQRAPLIGDRPRDTHISPAPTDEEAAR